MKAMNTLQCQPVHIASLLPAVILLSLLSREFTTGGYNIVTFCFPGKKVALHYICNVIILCMYVCMYVYMYVCVYIYIYIYIYIFRGFKTSDDAFRLSYSIAFDCSIHPFLDLFHSWFSFFFPLENITSQGLPSAVFSYVDVWELSPSMKPGISTPWSAWSSSPPISITSLQQTYSELHFYVFFRLLLDLPCGFFCWFLQPKFSMK
jgi:hypothetical protein